MSTIKRILLWVKKESKRSGKSLLTVMINMIADYLKYGVNPKEYYYFGFSSKTAEAKETFFTKRMFKRFLKRNNDPMYRQILNDKYIFSQTFEKYVKRKCIRNTNLTIADFEEFLTGMEKFIYKPGEGSGGTGIEVISKADYPCTEEIYKKIIALPEGVLEEWIDQHEVISAAYPYAVNCIRVATLFRDGKCTHLGALFTLGLNKNNITNALKGSIFGIVDLETGVVTSDLCNYSDQVFHEHPDTGFIAKGFEIPYWQEILKLTADAASVVPQVGYVGWDVAISKDGPVLIEGNSISAGYIGFQHSLVRSDGLGSRPIWGPFVK